VADPVHKEAAILIFLRCQEKDVTTQVFFLHPIIPHPFSTFFVGTCHTKKPVKREKNYFLIL
jgi:hypothetical protein